MATTELRIRPAKKEDQKFIREIIRRARLNPLGVHWQTFVIAQKPNGDFLGCAQIKDHRDGSSELASLYVDPAHRGRGIAAAIIRYFLSQAQSDLWLTCRSGLVLLYQSFGFVEIGDPSRMPAYFRRVWRLFNGLTRWSPQLERLAVLWWKKTGA
jgi:GNAT superfamily N-acetyltransferase